MNTFEIWPCRSRLATWIVFVAIFFLPFCSNAQNLPPALMVEENSRSIPMAISKVDVDVRILGYLAETRMTIEFRNSLNRPLAGDLYFPLPAGSTISGYALDVNGVMVDGVVVEKDRGRQVFEKETRKGVDPGLVEWTRGNHFKTRVFPIPPRGTRTIRVSYLSEILTDAQGSQYRLPLNFKQRLREFHVRLEVVKAQAKPVAQPAGPLALQFVASRESYIAEARRTNASVTGELVVSLPQMGQPSVLVEKASDGQYYFCINEFPVDLRPTPAEPTLPALNQVTIFWDASGSRGDTDHARELSWLRTWFAAHTRYPLAVNLIPFRNALGPVQRFVVTNGNATSLINAISEIAYDGGTQIGCLTNDPAAATNGCYFLFSDGLGNFGKGEPPAFDAPLYAFTSDQTMDQPFLQYLAQRSKGAVFPLKRFTDQQVLAATATRPFSFVGAEAPKAAVLELCPQTTQPLQRRFTLAGKLMGPDTTIVLNYGAGAEILSQSVHPVSRSSATQGELLRRFWAQKKLQDLLVFQKRNESEIAALGKEYGLVTPFTSLIVLERLDQYIEHRILPPASLPGMRADYARILEEQTKQAKKEESEKIEHLLALWDKRVAWWNREFRYPEDFKYHERKENGERRRPSALTALPGAANPQARPVAPDAGSGVSLPVAFENLSMDKATLSAREGRRGQPEPGIAIKEWDPKTPYLQALKKTRPQDAFAAYLVQRKKFGTSPAFYLDCAEYFRKQKQNELGIQVLSNIAELDLENAALLRALAYRLLQIGQLELACELFEQVLLMRPEEPQSFRDLALALAKRGQTNSNSTDCRRAMDLLAQVVNTQWDRFDEIEVIALMELNALWAESAKRFPRDNTKFPADERLRKLLDLDLRILLTWDADMTDVDIHVIEPSGERARYDHNLTTIGGLVSRDFTQGYGPEEYCLHKAMQGTYRIEANYYGSQAAQFIGPVTVQAEVITHFGRPHEKRKSLTLRLEKKEETVLIGEVEF